MNDIIVSTYGIGPMYRKRIIHNITKALDTGYDNIMPYIILTDKPDDFNELRDKTNKIIDVLNIHELRDKYAPWSIEYEYISRELEEEAYAIDYRKNSLQLGNHFSNAVHRFSLPRIHELKYKKLLWCECDTDIRYDKIVSGEITEEKFWSVCDIPVNSVRGCDLQTWSHPHDRHSWDNENIIMGNILRFVMCQRHPEYLNTHQPEGPYFLRQSHTQTEGIRYYHLQNHEMVLTYFNLWDEVMKLCMTTKEFATHLKIGGGYIYIDNTPITVVNDLLGIAKLELPKWWHQVNIYFADRHSIPRGVHWNVNGKSMGLQPANTVAKFHEINAELIEYLKSIGQWPSIH